ncbi:MAG: TadE/TadG family type IV pilus assembly protein [Bryobacteraceae bacterium]
MRRFWRATGGQEVVEYALLSAGVIVPLTFSIIFVGEMFWVWHSVVDYTRDGARYAATHCWQSDAANVQTYMTTHVPRMIDMDQFQGGAATITVQYFAKDPETGELIDFSCEGGDCSTACVPDAVSVSVTNYEFRRFVGFFGLPAVPLPDFRASMAMGGAGCDETGTCLP